MRSNGLALKSRRDTDDPVAALASDVALLRRDLAALARRSVGDLGDRMKGASDSAKQLADVARKRAADAADSVSDFASERPMATIAIAVIAGAMIASLLMSRVRR